jgi:hypothetical protein
MSEEQTEQTTEETTYTAEQFSALQAQLEESNANNDSMKAKMDQLLGETKQAKARQRQADEEAAAVARAKAMKDNDFEQLFKSSEEQASNYKTQLEELQTKIAKEKRNTEAMKIASQLADGFNAELLGEKIAQRLKYTDEGVKILDSNGQLTVSTVEDLKTEFQNNERFASLIRGNQSSGGGAPGGNGSRAADKVLTRSEFEGLDVQAKSDFFRSGGKLTE